jgi:hypothetical protein
MGEDLVEGLVIEAEALGSGNERELAASVAGDRLAARRAELAAIGGRAPVLPAATLETYVFETMTVVLLRDPNAPQAPPRLGIEATGTVRSGGGPGKPFVAAFPLVDGGGAFLITDQLPV